MLVIRVLLTPPCLRKGPERKKTQCPRDAAPLLMSDYSMQLPGIYNDLKS